MRKVLLSDRSLQLLFGPLDENAKFLENLFDVKIQPRGSSLTIDGEEANVATLEKILLDFSALTDKGHAITNGDLKSAFKQIAEDAALSLHDFFPRMQLLTAGKRQVTPKSLNQRRYVDAIKNNEIQLIINTPLGKVSRYDEYVIGRTAIVHSVPCLTTLSASWAAVQAIRTLQAKTLDVIALQDI